MRPAILLLVALAGCGAPDDNNHGYGSEYDLSTADGVRFRNDPPAIVYNQTQFEHMIVASYEEVETCAQIMSSGPLVIAVPDGSLGEATGETFWDGTLIITDSAVQDGWDIQFLSGVSGPRSVLRHEFVHYLLRASGFPDDLNTSHQSPLFVKCAGL